MAATNRFSNAGTTSETMRLASKLMESGANQQLVSKNITPDIENELFGMPGMKFDSSGEKVDADPTKLEIQHGDGENTDESKVVSGTVTEKESTLLDDLKAAEASLAAAGADITPDAENKPLEIDSAKEEDLPEVADEVKAEADHDADVMSAGIVNSEPASEAKVTEGVAGESGASALDGAGVAGAEGAGAEGAGVEGVNAEGAGVEGASAEGTNAENPSEGLISDKPEKVIQPSAGMNDIGLTGGDETEKYGQMLEDALAGADGGMASPVAGPVFSDPTAGEMMGNPAMTGAPAVPANPEINGVPEINYMPMPGEEVLPPPPAPPIDMSMPAVSSPEPVQEPVAGDVTAPLGAQPAMQDQVYAPQVADPGAFKIPGT